jgi:hypothetical protein
MAVMVRSLALPAHINQRVYGCNGEKVFILLKSLCAFKLLGFRGSVHILFLCVTCEAESFTSQRQSDNLLFHNVI